MNTAQRLLSGLQTDDGGWPAAAGGPSSTEVTSLSVMALRGAGDDDAVDQGLEWLRRNQRRDGGWPITEAIAESGWATSLAVLALVGDPSNHERAMKGARWLLEQEGRPVPWITRLFFRLFPRYDVVELEPDLKGWPWYCGTFGWVEPTAYALIALKAMRGKLSAEDRIEEGERLILDRTCRGGGWNYGNSRVYGDELWPYPDTTALALIALGDRADLPEVSAGLNALDRMLEANRSVLATSLGLMAHRAHDLESSDLEDRLGDRLEGKPAWLDVRALALAAMALEPSRTFGVVHD